MVGSAGTAASRAAWLTSEAKVRRGGAVRYPALACGPRPSVVDDDHELAAAAILLHESMRGDNLVEREPPVHVRTYAPRGHAVDDLL